MAGPLAPKLALARAAGGLSRLRGGAATSVPGKVLLRLQPDALSLLGARLERGSVLLSATNGKTTTAAMAAAILERDGVRLVHNRAGANMAGGIASTLLEAARGRDAIDGELGLFEVDELWLEQVAVQLRPRAVLLGNLFRDQLDRYGELDAIAARWAQVVERVFPADRSTQADERARAPTGGAAREPGETRTSDWTGGFRDRALVLNADDPLVADLGRGRPGVVYFGVDDDSLALAHMAHAADAKHCRNCGAPYHFEAVYLGHLGRYRCPSCGQARPSGAQLQVRATDVRLEGVRAARFTLHTPAGEAHVALPLPGLYNVYNALAAAALAYALEVPLEHIVAGLRETEAAFGRAERVVIAAPAHPSSSPCSSTSVQPARRELRILLVKNPSGANEVLRTLALEPGEHDLLGVLNDQLADGRDVSWIWDADFELLAGRVRRATCSGTRAAELAVRLKYAGVEPRRIAVQPDLAQALRAAAGDRACGDAPLYALPTYTAMLALRRLLAARGATGSALT